MFVEIFLIVEITLASELVTITTKTAEIAKLLLKRLVCAEELPKRYPVDRNLVIILIILIRHIIYLRLKLQNFQIRETNGASDKLFATVKK